MTEYTTCPQHPDVLLPVAEREAEQHFCPLCAQEQRAKVYEQQYAENFSLYLTTKKLRSE